MRALRTQLQEACNSRCFVDDRYKLFLWPFMHCRMHASKDSRSKQSLHRKLHQSERLKAGNAWCSVHAPLLAVCMCMHPSGNAPPLLGTSMHAPQLTSHLHPSCCRVGNQATRWARFEPAPPNGPPYQYQYSFNNVAKTILYPQLADTEPLAYPSAALRNLTTNKDAAKVSHLTAQCARLL